MNRNRSRFDTWSSLAFWLQSQNARELHVSKRDLLRFIDGELSSQDEYVRIWPNVAIYVCKITVLGPNAVQLPRPLPDGRGSASFAGSATFCRFTEPTWGRQSCLGTRFPARPSRLKSRLAAKIGCPTRWHNYFTTRP